MRASLQLFHQLLPGLAPAQLISRLGVQWRLRHITVEQHGGECCKRFPGSVLCSHSIIYYGLYTLRKWDIGSLSGELRIEAEVLTGKDAVLAHVDLNGEQRVCPFTLAWMMLLFLSLLWYIGRMVSFCLTLFGSQHGLLWSWHSVDSWWLYKRISMPRQLPELRSSSYSS